MKIAYFSVNLHDFSVILAIFEGFHADFYDLRDWILFWVARFYFVMDFIFNQFGRFYFELFGCIFI